MADVVSERGQVRGAAGAGLMRATDAQALAWADRQATACAEGDCKYANPLSDKPSARDSAACHGWHGTRVQTMREGAVMSDAIRYRRCAKFEAWIGASAERKRRREQGEQQRRQAAAPQGWGA